MKDAAQAVTNGALGMPDIQHPAVGASASFEDSLEPLLADGYRVAFAILRHRQDAEDALQEAAASAWSKRRHIRDETAVRAWFLAIVTNTSRMRLRSSWWRWGRAAGSDPALDIAEGPRHEVSVELRADLGRAMERLGWSQRAVLTLYYQLDMPQEEIARVLRVRVGTVKSRLSRATSLLRDAVYEEDAK